MSGNVLSRRTILIGWLLLLAGPGVPLAAGQVGEATSQSAIPGLDSLSAHVLLEALDYLEITPRELGFDKLYAEDDTFRLATVERLLDFPLEMPGWQTENLARLRRTIDHPAELARRLGLLCEAASDDPARPTFWPGTRPGEEQDARGALTGRSLDEHILRFLRTTGEAEQDLRRAFENWTAQERERLLMFAPAFWGDGDDPVDKARKGSLHFEFGTKVDTSVEMSEDFVLDLAVAVDREALSRATVRFLEGLCELACQVPPSAWPSGPAEFPGVEGAVSAWFDTPWGLLLVGGPGDNVYSYEALSKVSFLIEPGGDDVYRGRVASALGDLQWPFAALIDHGGDDLYDARGLSYALGGGLLGVAVLADASGNDVYRGDDGSLGAGFFGGGFLFDGGGVDLFEGRNLCQGAGAFGVGALVSASHSQAPPGKELQPDRAFEAGLHVTPGTGAVPIRYDDNDTYTCARQSQGFASTFGAGLLFDQEGNDIYRAGGHYLHAPLLPHDFQALSQGFSIGFRPRAGGGIGILMDEAGNDFYDGEVYSQGSAYWYSLGVLYDGGGNDRYLATQYSQGAGIHLAAGSLWDRGGDDHYVCKYGVTQGTAHDLSIGWLYDESGKDYYLVSDGHGMSITNSVAVFIDVLGDDVYATPGVGQGTVTWARGFCGAGLFLDLEGRDHYPANGPGQDGAVWRQQTYGLGIDLDRDVDLPGEVVPDILLTAADSLREVAELFKTASLWEVGSAREKVRRARKALIAKGPEALVYVAREKLGTKSGLEYRAIRELADAYPDTAAALVLPHLEDDEEDVQRTVIRLLGDLKRAEAREPLEKMLRKKAHEKHWNRLLGALGQIGEAESAPAIRRFLGDDEERRRLASIGAIVALKDTASVDVLVRMLSDPQLTVRSASLRALGGFAAAAIDPLCRSLQDWNDERLTPHESQAALRTQALGQLAAALADSTDEVSLRARGRARRQLVATLDEALDEDTPSVRAEAVAALVRFGDAETLAHVALRMSDEYDPLVHRTYEHALKRLED